MTKTRIISIIAIIILLLVLVKGLAFAWLGMKVLNFAFIILAFVAVGYLWGKFTK